MRPRLKDRPETADNIMGWFPRGEIRNVTKMPQDEHPLCPAGIFAEAGKHRLSVEPRPTGGGSTAVTGGKERDYEGSMSEVSA